MRKYWSISLFHSQCCSRSTNLDLGIRVEVIVVGRVQDLLDVNVHASVVGPVVRPMRHLAYDRLV